MSGPSLTPDERPEWDALIRQAINGDMSATDITAKTHRVLDLLNDAEQGQRTWAARALEEATFNGMRAFLKQWVRANNVAGYKSYDGTISSRSLRIGVERDGTHQQVIFEEVTRDELAGHITMLRNQRSGLKERIDAEVDVLTICDAHPECLTVGEALAAAEVTLVDVLGRAA